MAEPALHEIERHAGADCVKVEAMAQALGCRVRPGRNFGMSHDALDQLPRAAVRQRPQSLGRLFPDKRIRAE
jgi:hypothetical protein